MIDDGQLRIWAAEAREARRSALWEYCPDEFWKLLREIAELKKEIERLKVRERACEDELHRMLGTMVQVKERLQLLMVENARLTTFADALKNEE